MATKQNNSATSPDLDGQSTPPVRYVFSQGFAALLEQSGASLVVTTYQAGKLMAVRARGGKVSTLLRSFERPMGFALGRDQLALGTRNAIWFLHNAADIAPQLDPPNSHDACYAPRKSHITGDILGHEMAWGKSSANVVASVNDELWVVNTRFSCLCTLDDRYSFVPRWKPWFVTQLAAEDRCHLNGLAMVEGKPKYVTALGMANEARGWKAEKAHGGILLDVEADEIVARGFSMPHSPRWYAGRLWVLSSGEGELQIVEPNSGRRETVVRLPGYTRGLSFHAQYAFVGLSRIREKEEFGGLPIESSVDVLQCGIWVVDLQRGVAVEFMAFETGCEEIFAVEVLPDARWPAIIGFKQETINGIFVIPPEKA